MSNHLFIHSMFIKYLLCSRLCPLHMGCKRFKTDKGPPLGSLISQCVCFLGERMFSGSNLGPGPGAGGPGPSSCTTCPAAFVLDSSANTRSSRTRVLPSPPPRLAFSAVSSDSADFRFCHHDLLSCCFLLGLPLPVPCPGAGLCSSVTLCSPPWLSTSTWPHWSSWLHRGSAWRPIHCCEQPHPCCVWMNFLLLW